jgi:predicted TIM-barrel fold metal-dependent hydrolase
VGGNHGVVIDADSHIREYADLDRTFRSFIDPEFREPYELLSAAVAKRAAAGQTTALFMHPQAVIEPSNEERPLGVYDTFGGTREDRPRHTSEARGPKKAPIPPSVHWDPAVRLDGMDQANVDVSILFPSAAASFCALRDVRFEAALDRAYHRFVSDYCAEAGGRLRWAAVAPMRDVAASVEELTTWAERDNNLVGVLLSPTCPDGSLLDNPDLHPLYQRCQDLDLPVLVHGGVLRPPYAPGSRDLNGAGFILRAVCQPWGGMAAVSALLGGGVFDLFPRLRAAVFETGAGWMPWLIEQLDASFESRPDLAPNLRQLPSEVLAEGRLMHAVESEEKYLEFCVDALGEDIWLFATDYPHTGSPWPHGVAHIADRPGLSDSAKRKILGENALRLCPRLSN